MPSRLSLRLLSLEWAVVRRLRRQRSAASAPSGVGASSGRAAPRSTGRAACSCQPRPHVAVGAADRPAGHAPALASRALPAVLAAAVPGRRFGAAPAPRARDRRADPQAGQGEALVGRGTHPGRACQARHRRRHVDGPTLPARVRAPRGADSPGPRSCGTTPRRSGPTISSRSPITSSAHVTRSSSSRAARAG